VGCEEVGCDVPGKDEWVEGDAVSADRFDGAVNEFDRAEGQDVNGGDVNELLGKVGAIGALNLCKKGDGEKTRWQVAEIWLVVS
jgi:hypothetical protein